MKAFWDGPTFRRLKPFEVSCEELCYSPVYAFVARIGDPARFDFPDEESYGANKKPWNASLAGPTVMPSPAPTIEEKGPIVVRAAINALALQAVVDKAGSLSRGEAFISTLFNIFMAAPNMADIVKVALDTGDMRMKVLHEVERDWVPAEAGVGLASNVGGMFYKPPTRTTELDLDGPTRGLGEATRIILAVPRKAFVDPLLLPFLASPLDDWPCSIGVFIGAFPLLVTSCTTLLGIAKSLRRSKIDENAEDGGAPKKK